MTRFEGSAELEGGSELGYEQTLEALLSLIGRPVLVLFSGADGSPIRTMTSTTENENFGFDAVGIGDTNHDGRIDYLVSAANLDTVYVIAG